jgi:hypothetical protein
MSDMALAPTEHENFGADPKELPKTLTQALALCTRAKPVLSWGER